jgi:hypothetical protein
VGAPIPETHPFFLTNFMRGIATRSSTKSTQLSFDQYSNAERMYSRLRAINILTHIFLNILHIKLVLEYIKIIFFRATTGFLIKIRVHFSNLIKFL